MIAQRQPAAPEPQPPCETRSTADLAGEVARIGREVAATHAADVDQQSRFPAESFAELRSKGLLAAFVPRDLGGLGHGMVELAATCESLGQHCSATAMVLAMHHIQVACLVRHGLGSPFLRNYLKALAESQWLIASATSEVGVGGSMRTSVCAVERDDTGVKLTKDATTISYGEHAHAILATARRTPEAPESDQVLVLLKKGEYQLRKTSGWDTLGMRGTCSPGFLLSWSGTEEHIVPAPFAEISSHTMVPFSHILWSSLWLGIATAAVTKARAFVREQARRTPGTTPPTAVRLAELWNRLQTFRTNVHDVAAECQSLMASQAGTETLSTIGFAIKMNNLKIASSEMVADIVHQALRICGIAGYKNDSKFGLGRQLRDAHSAALMVGNDRIYATNASLLLVYKDE